MRKIEILTLLCLAMSVAHGQQMEVQVNKAGNDMYPNEPSICLSRTHPNRVVICANISFCYTSSDSGKVWKGSQIKTSHGMYGDPVLHASHDGSIYLTHLSKTSGEDKEKDYRFIDRIVVQKSNEGDSSFANGSFTGFNQDKMQDKPWMSSDEFSERKGNLYVTWTEFDKINSKKKKYKSRIRFSASADQANSWSEAITISDTTGDCVDDDHTLEGATTAIGKDGTIYCVWAGHNLLYFDKSHDGGKTWGRDKVIGKQLSGWTMDIHEVWRSNGMPFLLRDNSGGLNDGRLYVIYGDTLFGDPDIFMIFSDDDGASWTQPIRVNQDAKGNGKSQYMPNAAIDQTNGDLVVVYYDRRFSEHDLFSDVVMAVLKSGAAEFTEVKMNRILSAPYGKNTFSGDYIDVDVHDGQVGVVWNAHQEFSKLFSVVGILDSMMMMTTRMDWGADQITWYSVHKRGRKTIFFRTNQPMKLTYNYSYKKLFGWIKVTSNTTDSLECAVDGSQTMEYKIVYPKARRYETFIEFKNGERQVLKITSKGS